VLEQDLAGDVVDDELVEGGHELPLQFEDVDVKIDRDLGSHLIVVSEEDAAPNAGTGAMVQVECCQV